MNRVAYYKKAFSRALHISAEDHPKIVLMSDCHRGTGNWADSFLSNRPVYTAALKYYIQKSFTYIELGDGDELWGNRRFADIYRTHREVFQLFQLLAEEDRIFLLYGNHDREKELGVYRTKTVPFPIPFHQSLIVDFPDGPDLYLFHGCQGDFLNDRHWKLTRSLVRYIWKPLELRGFKDPTSAAKNYTKVRETEENFMTFSRENQCILGAGHTHKPSLMQTDGGMYINSGSCVHPGAITAIEINAQRKKATLVKWSICSHKDMSLYVCRERLKELPMQLSR
ncbi:MAG: metallophosphoesterase family protein [Firmicutes bacterium]|nr:metallophosphoesterase family protein [Bacillota bacterium]